MRPISCCVALAVIILLSCHQRSGTTGNHPGIPDSLAKKAMGVYSGRFNNSLFSLVINYISGKTVSGYDVHKGQRRNLNGEVIQQGSLLNFVLKEPGGNPFDGVFQFALDTASLKITGKWIPFDSTKISSRKLTLTPSNTQGLEWEDIWVGDNDSSILFRPDGICVFSFYPPTRQATTDTAAASADSAAASSNPTEQLITIKGNYEKSGQTYHIEWEKNTYLPVLKMKLAAVEGQEGTDSTAFVLPSLTGHGFHFTRGGD